MPEQHNLRVSGLPGQTTGDGQSLCYGRVTSQFVFTGTLNFARGDKIGLVEILYCDRDLWIVQHRRIGSTNRCSKLGHSHSVHVLLFQSSQIYEAIRPNADRLIKIRREDEPDLQHVTFTDPVQRTAVPHQELT